MLSIVSFVSSGALDSFSVSNKVRISLVSDRNGSEPLPDEILLLLAVALSEDSLGEEVASTEFMITLSEASSRLPPTTNSIAPATNKKARPRKRHRDPHAAGLERGFVSSGTFCHFHSARRSSFAGLTIGLGGRLFKRRRFLVAVVVVVVLIGVGSIHCETIV